mgnify:CR=1 FL=1
MAKYKGLVEFSGAIGDLVFYNLNGTPVVRRKSGFSKEAYQSNPNYQKVRENSSEFGHCSKVGKMIRLALEPYLENYDDKYLYQKFAKVMTQIKDLDTQQPKGQRRVQNGLQHKEAYSLLQSFQFGKYACLENIQFEGSFFTKAIQIPAKNNFEIIQLLTLKPDFDNLNIELEQQTLSIQAKKNQYEFDVHFQDSEIPLLYFLILKTKTEISQAGFIS